MTPRGRAQKSARLSSSRLAFWRCKPTSDARTANTRLKAFLRPATAGTSCKVLEPHSPARCWLHDARRSDRGTDLATVVERCLAARLPTSRLCHLGQGEGA